jgi:hypothetical protein
MALPFSFFGWRGLVALNTFAYLAAVAIVFVYTRRYATDRLTPWLGAAAFGLGGFAIEYAEGVWPQALSLCLVAGGMAAAGRAIDEDRVRSAALAGFLLGVACGVRYQNAVVLAVVWAAITLWARRHVRSGAAAALGASAPMLACSLLNHARFGLWNPVSKGPGYLKVPLVQGRAMSVFEPLTILWARVVDYSFRPRITGWMSAWLEYEPTTGVHLMHGVFARKALLQSAPWAVLALALFGVAWLPGFRVSNRQRSQLRLLSLATFSLLAIFSLAGAGRDEGYGFNQRYLLEILPFAAAAFAWALEGTGVRASHVLSGGLVGCGIAAAVWLSAPLIGDARNPMWIWRLRAIMKVPLLMSAGLLLAWIAARRSGRAAGALAVLAGACVGWGLVLHLVDDVFPSHWTRRYHLARTQELQAVMPDHSALVAYWSTADAAGPLLLDRDVVIVDAHKDEGADAPMLMHALMGENRRVFLATEGVPADVASRLLGTFRATPVSSGAAEVFELHDGASDALRRSAPDSGAPGSRRD